MQTTASRYLGRRTGRRTAAPDFRLTRAERGTSRGSLRSLLALLLDLKDDAGAKAHSLQ